MESWTGAHIGSLGLQNQAEERKGSIRENIHERFKSGKAFIICLHSVQTVDRRESQVTFYSLGGLETLSLGSVPEKNKSQDLSSYPRLVSISLNTEACLGADKFPEWGLGHICLLENIRHWGTKASRWSCDSNGNVFFSEEVNDRQIGAEGQRNRCSEKGPFCLPFVKGEGCETQERLGCEIFTKLSELKLAILVLWWYA